MEPFPSLPPTERLILITLPVAPARLSLAELGEATGASLFTLTKCPRHLVETGRIVRTKSERGHSLFSIKSEAL
jgi:hypothetical protein